MCLHFSKPATLSCTRATKKKKVIMLPISKTTFLANVHTHPIVLYLCLKIKPSGLDAKSSRKETKRWMMIIKCLVNFRKAQPTTAWECCKWWMWQFLKSCLTGQSARLPRTNVKLQKQKERSSRAQKIGELNIFFSPQNTQHYVWSPCFSRQQS